MHFILNKILKLLKLHAFSIISLCKVIWSQNQSVFWAHLQLPCTLASVFYIISQIHPVKHCSI